MTDEQKPTEPTKQTTEIDLNSAAQDALERSDEAQSQPEIAEAANEALEAEVEGTTDPTTYDATGEAEKLPEAETVFEESVAEAVEMSEEASDAPPVEAFDETVKEVVAATETHAEHIAHGEGETHAYSDTVVLPYVGEITAPGGIYTVIFGVLAVLTVFEVIIAELFADGFLKLITLVVASLAKAVLVVMFYMHLNTDNPIFRVILAVPLLVVIIAILYLIGAPAGAGLGYS